MKTPIIILAAGKAERMGKPKQLLLYRNKPLLANAIQIAEAANPPYLLVVTGSYSTEIRSAIAAKRVNWVYNENWQTGMASSIVAGLTQLLKLWPEADKVILMVADQPFLTTIVLEELEKLGEKSKKPIVACRYGNQTGTPAIFEKRFFEELLQLKGDKGAGKLIQQYRNELEEFSFPAGIIDIDTPTDYEQLDNKSNEFNSNGYI